MQSRAWFVHIYIILIPLLFQPVVLALDPETDVNKYIHHSWGTREGMPQNTVNAIVQDDTGYIWIGTGLGLDISNRIIRQHHGTMELRSEPGNTRFIMRLPIVAIEE